MENTNQENKELGFFGKGLLVIFLFFPLWIGLFVVTLIVLGDLMTAFGITAFVISMLTIQLI